MQRFEDLASRAGRLRAGGRPRTSRLPTMRRRPNAPMPTTGTTFAPLAGDDELDPLKAHATLPDDAGFFAVLSATSPTRDGYEQPMLSGELANSAARSAGGKYRPFEAL
jgi:hypothetical protein